MRLIDLYLRLNPFLQNISLNLEALRKKNRRYGGNFHLYLNQYESNDPLEIDLKRLKIFFLSARNTPFWRNKFKKYNIDPHSDHLLNEIKKLPIINKKIVKANAKKIQNSSIKLDSKIVSTSGTTGSGLSFLESREMEQRQWAVWWRYRKLHDISLRTWCGWFGGRVIMSINQKKPPYWRINYPFKQIMFSSYHLTQDTVEQYYIKLNNSKLKWLHGYPSQLSLFANLCRQKNLFKFPFLKKITCGAENLLEHQKEVIEKTFQVKVFQHYGLAEGVSNISEQVDGSLIIDQDFAYTELIPENSINESTYKIIGTNYNNFAFPLFRYDTGDLVSVKRNGSKLKILKIDGRKEDFIRLKNGKYLGRLDHVFKNLVHIKKAQFFQSKNGSITLSIIKGANYDSKKQENELNLELKKYFGKNNKVEIKYVNEILNSKSGKFRFVKSDFK